MLMLETSNKNDNIIVLLQIGSNCSFSQSCWNFSSKCSWTAFISYDDMHNIFIYILTFHKLQINVSKLSSSSIELNSGLQPAKMHWKPIHGPYKFESDPCQQQEITRTVHVIKVSHSSLFRRYTHSLSLYRYTILSTRKRLLFLCVHLQDLLVARALSSRNRSAPENS